MKYFELVYDQSSATFAQRKHRKRPCGTANVSSGKEPWPSPTALTPPEPSPWTTSPPCTTNPLTTRWIGEPAYASPPARIDDFEGARKQKV